MGHNTTTFADMVAALSRAETVEEKLRRSERVDTPCFGNTTTFADMVAAAHTQTARSTTAETPDDAMSDGRGSARSMSLAEYRERLRAIRARNGNVSSIRGENPSAGPEAVDRGETDRTPWQPRGEVALVNADGAANSAAAAWHGPGGTSI